MELINDELKNKIWTDVQDKVRKHAPYGSPVRNKITKNFGLWENDDLFRLKIYNPQWYIRRNLNENT